jgi:hypothetical protein
VSAKNLSAPIMSFSCSGFSIISKGSSSGSSSGFPYPLNRYRFWRSWKVSLKFLSTENKYFSSLTIISNMSEPQYLLDWLNLVISFTSIDSLISTTKLD